MSLRFAYMGKLHGLMEMPMVKIGRTIHIQNNTKGRKIEMPSRGLRGLLLALFACILIMQIRICNAQPERFGLPELISEDFQHDPLYGTVRVVDPFREVRR